MDIETAVQLKPNQLTFSLPKDILKSKSDDLSIRTHAIETGASKDVTDAILQCQRSGIQILFIVNHSFDSSKVGDLHDWNVITDLEDFNLRTNTIWKVEHAPNLGHLWPKTCVCYYHNKIFGVKGWENITNFALKITKIWQLFGRMPIVRQTTLDLATCISEKESLIFESLPTSPQITKSQMLFFVPYGERLDIYYNPGEYVEYKHFVQSVFKCYADGLSYVGVYNEIGAEIMRRSGMVRNIYNHQDVESELAKPCSNCNSKDYMNGPSVFMMLNKRINSSNGGKSRGKRP